MKISLNIIYIVTLLIYLTSGCTVTKKSISKDEATPDINPPVENTSISNNIENITTPEGGFSWEQLASIASHRNGESQLSALQIKRSTLQNRLDRAWRNPQLRLNSTFASEDEYDPKGSNEHEDINAYGAGLRFYISNPFVNKWIKKQESQSAKSITAAQRELSYAIYCETRMKCCEAAIIKDKLNQLNEALDQQKEICSRYTELKKNGYAAPLKIIKAGLKTARTEQQIQIMTREHRNTLFQLALLTGIDIDKLKVQPIDKQSIPDPSIYNSDDLTATAVRLRPDLETIHCEIALARSELRVAKARQIPWFEFVEGGYRNRDSDATSYAGTSTNHADSDRDEWTIRTAISLPFFNWTGDETALAETALKELLFRESLALGSVRNEIRNALQNYIDACSSNKKMRTNVNMRVQEFRDAVKELDSSKTVVETEIMDTEEQLNAFCRGTRQSLYDCLKQKLYLESVTGLNSTE